MEAVVITITIDPEFMSIITAHIMGYTLAVVLVNSTRASITVVRRVIHRAG